MEACLLVCENSIERLSRALNWEYRVLVIADWQISYRSGRLPCIHDEEYVT